MGGQGLSLGIGKDKGLSPFQTAAMLSRSVTCHIKHVSHLNKTNTGSVSPLNVDMFILIFSKRKQLWMQKCIYASLQ